MSSSDLPPQEHAGPAAGDTDPGQPAPAQGAMPPAGGAEAPAGGSAEAGREEPGGPTKGMEHRKPDSKCPLCGLWGIPWDPADPSTHGKQHIHAEEIWSLWDPTERDKAWPEKVAAEAAKHGLEVSAKQVKDHFAKHRIEQPMYSGRLQSEAMIERLLDAPPRTRAIVEGVYRQRVLLQRQINEIYFLSELSKESARKMHKAELKALAQEHFLYRYYPSKEDGERRGAKSLPYFSQSTLWFLGKVAVPYIQHRYGLSFTPPYVNRAREVAKNTLIHDIQANDVAVNLAEALRTQQLEGPLATTFGEIKAEFRRENWYGPGPMMLAMGFWDRRRQEQMRLQPDGFASIAIHPLDGGALPATQLPFFYEFDHGTKDTIDVARQLLAYHSLGRSGAATERFPELKAPGYSPPLLMVFSKVRDERRRLELVAQRMRTLWREEHGGEEPACPIMLVYEEDWRKNPLAPAVGIDVWDEDDRPTPFLDWLIRASRPLYEQAAITPNQILKLDPQAAPVKAEGAMSAEGIKKAHKARAQKAAERAAAQARDAAQIPQAPAAEGPAGGAPDPGQPSPDAGLGTAPDVGGLPDERERAQADGGEAPAAPGAPAAPAGHAAARDEETARMRQELEDAQRRIAELERLLTQSLAAQQAPAGEAEERAREQEAESASAEQATTAEAEGAGEGAVAQEPAEGAQAALAEPPVDASAGEASEAEERGAGDAPEPDAGEGQPTEPAEESADPGQGVADAPEEPASAADAPEEFAPAPFSAPGIDGLAQPSPADSWAIADGEDADDAEIEGDEEPRQDASFAHDDAPASLLADGEAGFEEPEGAGEPDFDGDDEPDQVLGDLAEDLRDDDDKAPSAAPANAGAGHDRPAEERGAALPDFEDAMQAAAPPAPQAPAPPPYAPPAPGPAPTPAPQPPYAPEQHSPAPSPFPDLEDPAPAEQGPEPARAPSDGPLSPAPPADGPEIPAEAHHGEGVSLDEVGDPELVIPVSPAPEPPAAEAPSAPEPAPQHPDPFAAAPPAAQPAPDVAPPAPTPAPPAPQPASEPAPVPMPAPAEQEPVPQEQGPEPVAPEPFPTVEPPASEQPVPAPAEQAPAAPAPAEPQPPAPPAHPAPAAEEQAPAASDPSLTIEERLSRQAAARRRARRRRG